MVLLSSCCCCFCTCFRLGLFLKSRLASVTPQYSPLVVPNVDLKLWLDCCYCARLGEFIRSFIRSCVWDRVWPWSIFFWGTCGSITFDPAVPRWTSLYCCCRGWSPLSNALGPSSKLPTLVELSSSTVHLLVHTRIRVAKKVHFVRKTPSLLFRGTPAVASCTNSTYRILRRTSAIDRSAPAMSLAWPFSHLEIVLAKTRLTRIVYCFSTDRSYFREFKFPMTMNFKILYLSRSW